jgi:hypothetical protein
MIAVTHAISVVAPVSDHRRRDCCRPGEVTRRDELALQARIGIVGAQSPAPEQTGQETQ